MPKYVKFYIGLCAIGFPLLAITLGFPLTIHSDKLYLTAPSAFETDGPWIALEDRILNTPKKEIHIAWAGYGGDSLIMAQFVNVIQQAQKQGKKIILDSDSVVYSAHAFTLCYADNVNKGPGFAATFHPMRRGGVIVTDTAFVTLMNAQLTQCIRKGWITQEDMDNIKMGKKVTVDYLGRSITEQDG